MPSKRIDELDARVVADADLLPVTPSGGPSGSATVAAIVAEGLSQPNSASAGAGASITISAANGVTSGAGGSIIIEPGLQATTGGNGGVTIKPKTGAGETTNIFRVLHSNGSPVISVNTDSYNVQMGNGAFIFQGVGSFFTMPASGEIRAPSYGAWFVTNPTIRFPSNSPNVAILYANVGIVRISNGSTGGGSLAYTSSTPAAITANQNDYVLTGSAFQRLNCTTASDITGIAPPTSGAHVDGRMIRLVSVGTATVTLKHNDAASTAANRIYMHAGNHTSLTVNEWADLVYDSTDNGSGAAGWRLVKYA
jgi:hypothetical protein